MLHASRNSISLAWNSAISLFITGVGSGSNRGGFDPTGGEISLYSPNMTFDVPLTIDIFE